MSERVEASALVVGHEDEVQRRLQRCVTTLQRMVDGGWFVAHEDTIGMEVELDLVDPLGQPRLVNDAVLARLGRADMQQEFGQFNVELNLAPRRLQDVRAATDRLATNRVAGPLRQLGAPRSGADATELDMILGEVAAGYRGFPSDRVDGDLPRASTPALSSPKVSPEMLVTRPRPPSLITSLSLSLSYMGAGGSE